MERPPLSVKLARDKAARKPLMSKHRLDYVARTNTLVDTLMKNGFVQEITGSDDVITAKLGYYIVMLAHHNVSQGLLEPLSVRVVTWWIRRVAEGEVDFTDIVHDLFREAGASLE